LLLLLYLTNFNAGKFNGICFALPGEKIPTAQTGILN